MISMKIIKMITCGLVICLIITVYLISQFPENNLLVSFLDIGQGDAIYIRTPDDYQIIIDGGPDTTILEEISEVMPLYNRTIDLVVLSHPHADHVNGLVEILKRYDVKRVMMTGTPYRNSYYIKLLELINEKDIQVVIANSENDLKLGSYLFIDVIWPEKVVAGKEFDNINNASPILRLLFGDSKILVSGDAEIEEEQQLLMSAFDIRADLFKAGHHGSRTSSSLSVLKTVKPNDVVIQSGRQNNYGHPHEETLKNLSDLGIKYRRNDFENRITLSYAL